MEHRHRGICGTESCLPVLSDAPLIFDHLWHEVLPPLTKSAPNSMAASNVIATLPRTSCAGESAERGSASRKAEVETICGGSAIDLQRLLTPLSTGLVADDSGPAKLLNLGINLKHGGDGRARFRGKIAYLYNLKEICWSETPCIAGPGAGGEPVDSFRRSAERLFYPQIAHTLCISHTVLLWIA